MNTFASTETGDLESFGVFSSGTALKRFYCENLTPKYLILQNNLDVTCLDRTVIAKNQICITPENDMEGIIKLSCRSVIGLCFASCSKIISSTTVAHSYEPLASTKSFLTTVAPSQEPLVSTKSFSFEHTVSQISDHVKTLSVEAFNAIVGVAVSSFLLLATTFIAWVTKKVLTKRSLHVPLAESLPLQHSFENPTAVITVHEPNDEMISTQASQTIERQNSNVSFHGPVIIGNDLFDDAKDSPTAK